MPREIYKSGYGKSHIRLLLSKDWNTFEPWTHNDQKIPYCYKCRDWSEDSKIFMDFWYIGPFAIIYAKWVG